MDLTRTCERCLENAATVEVLDLASERTEQLCEHCATLRFPPSDPLASLRDVLNDRTPEGLWRLVHLRGRIDEAFGTAITSAVRHLRASGVSRRRLASILDVSETRVSQIVHGTDDRRKAFALLRTGDDVSSETGALVDARVSHPAAQSMRRRHDAAVRQRRAQLQDASLIEVNADSPGGEARHYAAGYDSEGRWWGVDHGPDHEHRTVGTHRAWCLVCSEWCYPGAPCVRCASTESAERTIPHSTTATHFGTDTHVATDDQDDEDAGDEDPDDQDDEDADGEDPDDPDDPNDPDDPDDEDLDAPPAYLRILERAARKQR